MIYDMEKVIDDIIESFSTKIDITKINDDNYIKNFIDENLHNEIMTTIYDKLLSMSIHENEDIIYNNYNYTIYKTIQIYKKWFDYNELNILIDNNDYLNNEYYVINKNNEMELKYYAKLVLSLIYDDFMTDNKYKNDILVFIKDYINDHKNDDDDC
jgi:hypothetical protein